MATISSVLSGIKQQLHVYLPASEVHALCQAFGYRFRVRCLPPVQSVHLLCIQILAQVALENLRHVAGLADISAQAISKARQKLPLPVLLALVSQVARRMSCVPVRTCWHGHRIILADGTTLLTCDTPALAAYSGRLYDRLYNDPRIRLLAVVDYSTGMILDVLGMPRFTQEISCLHRLFRFLKPGDLILGDRGLVNYAALALMIKQELQGCFRLPQPFYVNSKGRKHGRRIRQFSPQDHLVCWQRGKPCRWMSRRRFRALPETLLLRQIEYQIIRPGFKTTRAWLITTLLDPRQYPAQELVGLYEKRWRIEQCFRNIKSSLKMQGFRARTYKAIRKEIAGIVLLYNLVRQVMLQAAENQQVDPERISFKNALYWLLYAQAGERPSRLKVNSIRRRASEPRMLKRRICKYPQLKVPRQNLQLPPPAYCYAGDFLS